MYGPQKSHSQQEIIQRNISFSKILSFQDFTGFPAENFHLISVSTLEIFLHIFHEKMQLFIIAITKVTQAIFLGISKSIYCSYKMGMTSQPPGYGTTLYLLTFDYTAETKGRISVVFISFYFADFTK